MSILEHYNEVRRSAFLDHIDPTTRANLIRLAQAPENAIAEDFFIRSLREQGQPFADQIQQTAVEKMQHDFTQYYIAQT